MRRMPWKLTSPACRIPHNKEVYKQRAADERANSQAKALSIERPRLRRGDAITNRNALIYVLINLRALQRIRARKEELARQPEMLPQPGA